MSMKTITGYVEIITFRNEENGYTVLTMSVGKKDVKVTGVFGYIGEGEYIEVEGEEVFHPVFGEQIKMKSYKTIPANDEYSIRKYLGSGAIKGLGLALADRIVDKFKEDTFRIVDEEPERLEEVRGISYKKAMDIASQIQAKKDIRDAMIFLQKYGISSAMSLKIYNYYGEEIYQIIKKNPYRIADEIRGIGFTTADEIAKRAGVEVNASIRVKSGMVYALSKASESGHTYLPKENLIQATISLLGLRDQYQNADGTYNMDLLDNYFIDLVMEKKLIVKEINEVQAVFLSTYYYTEMNVAGMLLDLDLSMPADEFVESVKLDTIQRKNNIVLDDLQKEAVMATQSNGVVILTGGPGTGKTTTTMLLSGILKPYRGKIKVRGKIGFLPQDVQILFEQESVMEELKKVDKSLIEKMNLQKLLNMHPYDLSGGEQQKVALAKVLGEKPAVLLLDEPTKGIDNIYKEQLGILLRDLAENGKTIILVSHDLDFCGEYSDRCGLFAQGSLISENTAREFFLNNRFYTTTIAKLARGIIDGAYKMEDML